MTNLDFITTNLATGGDLPENERAAGRVLREWQRLGITHIIDNRLEWCDEDFVAEWAPEIHYLDNGVDDHGMTMPDEWFDDGLAFVRAALLDPNAKLLTHCHMGINRGPSMAYAILLGTGWDPIEAIAAVRSARPIAAVGYAEDALGWHHRRSSTPSTEIRRDRRRLACWRRENWIDVVRIIRDIRATEAS